MNLLKQMELVDDIKQLKEEKNFENYNLNQLRDLKNFNGIAEFNFNNFSFYMLNIAKDDGVFI